MLKFFSRLERTRNVVLIIFAAVMVLSLVLLIPTDNTQPTNSTRSTETVAKVGGENITVGEVATVSQLYRGAIPASQILNSLIPSRIIRLEAARLGLTASDRELADEIVKQNKPEDGSAFDQKRYEQNVTAQFGGVKAYEQSLRDQISGQKVEAFITSGVTVSEEEVLNDFRRRNTKFDLSFVPVSTAELAQKLQPSEDELKNYFEQNKKSYYITQPQKKIRYIFVNTSKLGEKLTIPEEELKAEYDKLTPERKQAGVQGQQIVLRVARPELEEQVLAKANEIIERTRTGGGTISEEAFAEIARGQSEDPRTAPNGGKIPGLVKPNPNNPTDPYQRLLSIQEGEVTEPVKFGTSYYILRRGAVVPKTYEDAKKEIEVSLRNRRAYSTAAELAQRITEDLKQTKDVQATAQKFAAEANSNVAEMVRETPFVKQGDEVPNVGISPQFEEGIAPLESQGQVGERIPIKDGFAIPLLVEKRDPHEATFEEVRDQVAENYKQKLAQERVEQTAREIASTAANAGNLASLAQSKGLSAQESKNFILGSPLGQGPTAATPSEELENAIYNLKAGEVTKTPVKVGDSWYIVGATNRTEADTNEFAKQRDELVQTMLLQKRGQVFSDYLADVRRRMEADGQIKIYKDALTKIDETATTEE